jgi:hypothetical protein
MTIKRRTQRMVLGTLGVILAIPWLTMLLSSRDPRWFRAIGLCLAVVVVAPSAAFVCGVRWCRFIVGALSLFFLLFWSPSPLMQHAIDRHAGFWCLWALVEVGLITTTVASFTRTSEAENEA